MRLAVLGSAVLVLSVAGCASAQCLPPSAFAERVQRRLVPIVAGADSTAAALRELYQLHQVRPDEVRYVNDEGLCRRAATALGELGNPVRQYPLGVWVLAVGASRYLVFDGTQRAGGHVQLLVFDDQLKQLGNVPF